MSALVYVVSIEEEWRTAGRSSVGHHGRRSYGRVCLWCKLACGHYPVQRMAKLDKRGGFVPPVRARCRECPS